MSGSPWHKNLKSKGPDGDIGSPPEFAKALEAGENVWAYHSGLTVDSHSSEALLVNAAYEAGDSNPNEKILITSVSGSTQIVSGSRARELAMKETDGTKWLQPLK